MTGEQRDNALPPFNPPAPRLCHLRNYISRIIHIVRLWRNGARCNQCRQLYRKGRGEGEKERGGATAARAKSMEFRRGRTSRHHSLRRTFPWNFSGASNLTNDGRNEKSTFALKTRARSWKPWCNKHCVCMCVFTDIRTIGMYTAVPKRI